MARKSKVHTIKQCPKCFEIAESDANYCGKCRFPLSDYAKEQDKLVDQFVLLMINDRVKKIEEELSFIKTSIKGLNDPIFRVAVSELIIKYQNKQ